MAGPAAPPHPASCEVTASSQSAGEYDAPAGVSGFEFTLVILSTWGDAYYVGLCGLQLLAPSGQALHVSLKQVQASPSSVNELPDAVAAPTSDPRVPANLVSGSVEPESVDESWLAPHAASLVPGQPNVVRIVFDEPVAVAALLVHNYAKTPTRGVREYQLWVDGCIAYHGLLPPRTRAPHGHLVTFGTPSFPVRLLPPVRGSGAEPHPALLTPCPPRRPEAGRQAGRAGRRAGRGLHQRRPRRGQERGATACNGNGLPLQRAGRLGEEAGDRGAPGCPRVGRVPHPPRLDGTVGGTNAARWRAGLLRESGGGGESTGGGRHFRGRPGR